MASADDHLIRSARIMVLLIWTWFLGWLMLPAGTRQLAKLLHPDLWWLVTAGSVVVLLFTVATFCNRAPRRTTIFRRLASMPRMLLLLLPILYFTNIGHGQLGEDALRKRSLAGGLNGVIALSSEEVLKQRQATDPSAEMPPAPADFAAVARLEEKKTADGVTIKSVVDDFQRLILEPSSHIDKKVTLLGLVHREKDFGPQTFYCFRFRITCCAADAMPVGVLVRHQISNELMAGSWVRVDGIMRQTFKESSSKLFLEAVTVVPAGAPDFPYVF